jgi:hypothetical protein
MKKLNKKKTLVISGSVLAAICIVAFLLFILHKKTTPEIRTTAAKISEQSTPDAAPANTVSPLELTKSILKYKDQEVQVYGYIYEVGKDKFIIQDPTSKENNGMIIESKDPSINLGDYKRQPTPTSTGKATSSDSLNGAVTVKGKLLFDQPQKDKPSSIKFIVSSVTK